jgi:hypothetical protein
MVFWNRQFLRAIEAECHTNVTKVMICPEEGGDDTGRGDIQVSFTAL